MTVRRLMEELCWALQRRIVPGLRDSQYEYKDVVCAFAAARTPWLDLGCGHHMFGAWMQREQREALALARSIIGLDYSWESLRKHQGIRDRVAGDVYSLPFRANSFDLITANMVVEHLPHPAAALQEINRCLRDKGILVFHTPNVMNYQFRIASFLPQRAKNLIVRFLEGRRAQDVFPTHYEINRPDVLPELARSNGYRLREVKMVNSSPETIMLGPLAILELLVIRMLSNECLKQYRSNIIAIFEKQPAERSTETETTELAAVMASHD